jgi:hypothetical protein
MKTQGDSASHLFDGPVPNQLLLSLYPVPEALLLTTVFKVADRYEALYWTHMLQLNVIS